MRVSKLLRKVTDEEFNRAYNDEVVRKVVGAVSRKFKRIPAEERKSCELIAIWKTLAYHQEGKGNKFTTSLWRISNWEFLKEYKNLFNKNRIKTVDFGNASPIASEENTDMFHLKECISLLSVSHQEILMLYMIQKHTMQEIGDMYGFSKETARQRINKAMIQLRRYL